MSTFASVLADQLRHEPSRPLITFYDHATDERVELSVTTYANWVAKVAGLLVEEGDLERGMRVRLDLPTHWLGPVFLGAAWSVGARVSQDDDAEVVVCGPDSVAAWSAHTPRQVVLACSLLPLGVRFAEPLPPGVRDVGVEVWSQPDAFFAPDPPQGSDLATDDLTQAEMVEAATAGSLLTDGGRLLSVANPASPPDVATFTEPLVRSGSLVLVRHPDPARIDGVLTAERVTARHQPPRL